MLFFKFEHLQFSCMNVHEKLRDVFFMLSFTWFFVCVFSETCLHNCFTSLFLRICIVYTFLKISPNRLLKLTMYQTTVQLVQHLSLIRFQKKILTTAWNY